MTISKILLASVAALAISACGKKEGGADAPRTEASTQAAKVDSGSPLDSTFKLKNAEAIDIDKLFALMPQSRRPTYDSAEFDKNLGATVVKNLRFSDANDGEGLNIARAEFFGVDLDAIDRIKVSNGGAADAAFETVFNKVRLFDVSSVGFGEDDANLTIGGVEIDNLELRQSGFQGDGAGDEGARALNATKLAGLYFKDIALAAENEDTPSINFNAPDLRFVGIGGGKLNAVIANDLEYSMSQTQASIEAMRKAMGPQAGLLLSGPLSAIIAPNSQRTKVNSFEWRNIDVSGLLDWGLKDEEPPMTAKDLIDLGTISVAETEGFIGDKRAYYMKEATVSAMDFTWLIPSNIRADTKGAMYDFSAYLPDTEEKALKVVKEHGLNDVKGDGFAEWKWNADSGAASLDYAADTVGFADFALNAKFSAAKLKDMAAVKDDGSDNPFASVGKFNSLSMTVTDEKALDAIFAIAALQMGGTGEDLRLSTPAMIRLSGAQAAQMNSKFSDYVNAVADFIGKGGTLEVEAQPQDPVAFSALDNLSPQTLPDVLGLKVTHKK